MVDCKYSQRVIPSANERQLSILDNLNCLPVCNVSDQDHGLISEHKLAIPAQYMAYELQSAIFLQSSDLFYCYHWP